MTLAEAQAQAKAFDKLLKAATPEQRAQWAKEDKAAQERWEEIQRNTPEAERREMEDGERLASEADANK